MEHFSEWWVFLGRESKSAEVERWSDHIATHYKYIDDSLNKKPVIFRC